MTPCARVFSETRSGTEVSETTPSTRLSYHKPIEMKFCKSHYGHKSISDTKFDSSNFSSFGAMKSQSFPFKKGNESSDLDICAWKIGLTLKK